MIQITCFIFGWISELDLIHKSVFTILYSLANIFCSLASSFCFLSQISYHLIIFWEFEIEKYLQMKLTLVSCIWSCYIIWQYPIFLAIEIILVSVLSLILLPLLLILTFFFICTEMNIIVKNLAKNKGCLYRGLVIIKILKFYIKMYQS